MRVDCVESISEADRGNDPKFIPAKYTDDVGDIKTGVYVDDRGYSLTNLMGGLLTNQCQINISQLNPGAVKAWHLHEKQTDYMVAASGTIKVGIRGTIASGHSNRPPTWGIVLSPMKPGVLVIPPKLWHGVSHIAGNAVLVYAVTKPYKTDREGRPCDEQRCPADSIPFNWGIESK